MRKNVGNTDKLIRFIIALAAVWAAYTGLAQSPWTYVLYAVAAIMVLTALKSTCPDLAHDGYQYDQVKIEIKNRAMARFFISKN